MSFDKCLALIFSLMILGQAYLVRRLVGTWLFPACIFGLFWFGFTFLPLAILFWVPVNPYAIGFIFLCTMAFSLGLVPFDWKTAFKRNAQKREIAAMVYGSGFLRRAFYATALGSLVFVILDTLEQGISLHDLLFNLITSAAAYRELVTYGNLDVTIFGRLGTVFAFLGTILGGLLFSVTPKKRGRLVVVVLSFLPPIFVAVAQSSKWTLFASIVFFWAGVLVHRTSVGKLQLLGKGSIKLLILCVPLLILIVTISFVSRGLYDITDSEELRGLLLARYTSYSCGHIYAFSDWFSFVSGGHSELTYAHEGATYGYYTFGPLFRTLGSHRVLPQGTFDDYYSYSDLLTTNIYTMFRGLVTDFGFIGSVLFMVASGLMLHWAFHAMLRTIKPVFTTALFVFAVAYSYWSFGVSMLSVSTTYLTFALLWAVLQVNKLIAQRAGRRLQIPGATRELALRS
jgi:oligosaccharide repeat unit polymerase